MRSGTDCCSASDSRIRSWSIESCGVPKNISRSARHDHHAAHHLAGARVLTQIDTDQSPHGQKSDPSRQRAGSERRSNGSHRPLVSELTYSIPGIVNAKIDGLVGNQTADRGDTARWRLRTGRRSCHGGSNARSSTVGVARPDKTNSRPAIWRLSSSYQSELGCALMIPRPNDRPAARAGIRSASCQNAPIGRPK